jgi:uncharacterized protein YcfJ
MKQIVAAVAGFTAMVAFAHGAWAQYFPTFQAAPPPNKPYAVFQQDNAVCQNWANQQTYYYQQRANNDVAGGVVGGAVGGALIGGLLGGGRGAAIGAGAGAVTGGAVGAANAQNAQAYGQQTFDNLYQRCMINRGNVINYGPGPGGGPPPPPPPGSAPGQ